MKPLALAAALLIAASSHAAEAKPMRHAKRYIPYSAGHYYREPRSEGSDWYPHDTRELPVGSRRWFDQMLRENRRNPG